MDFLLSNYVMTSMPNFSFWVNNPTVNIYCISFNKFFCCAAEYNAVKQAPSILKLLVLKLKTDKCNLVQFKYFLPVKTHLDQFNYIKTWCN